MRWPGSCPIRLSRSWCGGMGVAGICLIRLAHIRPAFAPGRWGVGSENAAHRIAVRLPDGDEAVYIRHAETPTRG